MIDRKFDNENDQQYVKMLLQKCLLQQFTQYIFLYENFLALTQMELTYEKANCVVKCSVFNRTSKWVKSFKTLFS